MSQILLIQPAIQDYYLTAKRTLPYGLASISASLRQAGFSVSILDALATSKSRIITWPEEMSYLKSYYERSDASPFGLFHHFRHFGYSLEHIANQARQSGAFLIGISSLFSAYSDLAIQTAEAIKRVCPDAYIVLGGHHPTALPEQVMTNPAIDFVLRGDGEIGLPLLAKALDSGRSLRNIPGLVQRCDDGSLSVEPPAVVKELDALPTPAWDLIRWSHYQRRGMASIALTAGRGCPMRCTYCSVNSASYHGFRIRSVDGVVNEVTSASQNRPVGFIDFEDEHLCSDQQWFRALLAALRRRFGHNMPELRAMNGLFAPALTTPTIKLMKSAGFKTLNLALITTAAHQLKRFRRPNIVQALDRVIADSQAYGLNCVVYIIVAGPGQSPGDALDDLIYLAQRPVLAGVSTFYPSPGSEDYQWCLNRQQLPEKMSLLRATALPLADQTSRKQAVTLMRLGRLLNFMKSLIDQGVGLPTPALPEKMAEVPASRKELGRALLAGFLKDGLIRGIDDRGKIYVHDVDARLCMDFLAGLKGITLKGALNTAP